MSIPTLGDRMTPEVKKRIEMLGEMNKRYERLLVAGNRKGLLMLAAEYEEKQMPMMAARMKLEAEELDT